MAVTYFPDLLTSFTTLVFSFVGITVPQHNHASQACMYHFVVWLLLFMVFFSIKFLLSFFYYGFLFCFNASREQCPLRLFRLWISRISVHQLQLFSCLVVQSHDRQPCNEPWIIYGYPVPWQVQGWTTCCGPLTIRPAGWPSMFTFTFSSLIFCLDKCYSALWLVRIKSRVSIRVISVTLVISTISVTE